MISAPPSRRFNGVDGTVAQWSASGTWLQSFDLVNPAVTLAGHGSGITGINFIYEQPIPGATFTPTMYPWAISCVASFTLIENITVIAATHGLAISYPEGSGGGTGVNVRNLMLSCFVRGIFTDRVNDVMCLDNIHIRNLYYATTQSVITYMYNNLVGWDCHYCDNPMIKGLEFFQCKTAFLFTDSTCLGNTHSAYNWLVVDVQHFGGAFCEVGAVDTHVTGMWSNILVQSETDQGQTIEMFNLQSDNADISLNNVYMIAGGGGFSVGNGGGGRLSVDGLKVLGYSELASGQPLFQIQANATLVLGSRSITKPAGAGMTITGAGVGEIISADDMVWQVFSVQPPNITGNGTDEFVALANQFDPIKGGKYQAKISGVLQVVTPQSGGTAHVKLSGFPEIDSGTLNCAASGNVAIDSNWIDFSSPSGPLGAIVVNATNGVVYNFATLTVQLR
jgi:hypothetical protein